VKRLARVILAGAHVRLEPLSREHTGGLLEAANASRATYTLTPVPDSAHAMQTYVDGLLQQEDRGEALPFVVLDVHRTVVGATRFMSIEQWDWPKGAPPPLPDGPDVLEIGGTWYAERAQRTAVNTEAKLLLCSHAFEVLRVRRVSWKTDARNTRSREAILRLGARFEGVRRAERPGADGTVRDSAYYSMLESEWPEAKRNLMKKLASHLTQTARSAR
jgi:N-acetyltransferase